MLIDWFTVVAQIVNFLILVWLLKIFLYKPILKMIADRQSEIDAQLNEAKLKKREAEEECEVFRKKNSEIDQQKNEKIKKLDEEISQLQEHLTSEAKLEVEKQKSKWYASLKNEKDDVFRDLSGRIQREIFSIVHKIVVDLSGADLEEHIVNAFLQRLKGLGGEKNKNFINFLQSSGTLQIRTASELNKAMREKIKLAIQKEFDREIDMTFIVSPNLIGGIVLIANGQKMSWNIADYLISLESQVNEVVTKNPERSSG